MFAVSLPMARSPRRATALFIRNGRFHVLCRFANKPFGDFSVYSTKPFFGWQVTLTVQNGWIPNGGYMDKILTQRIVVVALSTASTGSNSIGLTAQWKVLMFLGKRLPTHRDAIQFISRKKENCRLHPKFQRGELARDWQWLPLAAIGRGGNWLASILGRQHSGRRAQTTDGRWGCQQLGVRQGLPKDLS